MRVGYKKGWGVAMLALSGLLMMMLVVSGAFARQDMSLYGPALAAISSGICGICYLTRPCFELGADRITLFALLGPLRREYPYSGATDLRLEGGRLFVRGKKVPIWRFQADGTDWERFVAQIGGK